MLYENLHPCGVRSQLPILSLLRYNCGLFSCEANDNYGREEKCIQLIEKDDIHFAHLTQNCIITHKSLCVVIVCGH